MGGILFIAHRIPFPPDRGDKIRSHHVLKALAAIAPVHVATFADDEADFAHEHELAALAASYRLVRRSKPLPLAGAEALLRRCPVSLAAFDDRALKAYVAEVLAQGPIAAIYVFSGQMAQYVPADFAGRVVIDFVDVDSAKFEAYADRGAWPMRFIHAREGRLLGVHESQASMRADVSLLVSEQEAGLFRSRLPEGAGTDATVRVIGNGVDTTLFDPAVVAAEPRMMACQGPRLIFTGQMDYPPNVAAAQRAALRIMPAVREGAPGATLHVVGRNPPPALTALHGKNGIHVWGRVDDMRPWLKAADMALVPLEIARGVQNKVLEAMAMGLPVVLTGHAATGIGATGGVHFAIADSDAALAGAVVGILGGCGKGEAMGRAARAFVLAEASWQAALSDLPDLIGIPQDEARNAA